MSRTGRERIETLFAGETADDQLIADVISIVADAGGIDAARQRGEQFARDAEEALRRLPESPARAALGDAISYVMDRRS